MPNEQDARSAQRRSRSRTPDDPLAAAIVHGVTDYAILMLDRDGYVMTWNPGAERIKGYSSEEIIGLHFGVFYPREDVAAGKPDSALESAATNGLYREEGWRVRKDGSRFWATVSITALWGEGRLRGFAKLTRDDTERRRAAQERLRVEILQDEERIAQELHHEVIQRLFAVGMRLQGARTVSHEPEVASRIDAAVEDIDEVVRHIRMTLWSDAAGAGDEVEGGTNATDVESVRDDEEIGLHALVVDDDEDMRVLLASWLGEIGNVHVVSDAYQALQWLDAEPVDVMILDLLLPGAGGVDLLEQLDARGRHVPTVVVTGMDTSDALALSAQAAGASVVMTKPFDRRLLLASVLDAARAPDAVG